VGIRQHTEVRLIMLPNAAGLDVQDRRRPNLNFAHLANGPVYWLRTWLRPYG
jgi:hypothetical protein